MGKFYHVRKDNTVSYRGNFYSLPLGSYEGPGTKVLLRLEEGHLLIQNKDNRIIAKHLLEHAKGNIVMNNHHLRDTSEKIQVLQDELCRLFSDQQKATLFLETIRRRFPRYPRDQFQHIRKTISNVPGELIDRTLAYCVTNQLFSCGEFHDILQSLVKTNDRKTNKALEEFKPRTPMGDLAVILSVRPECSNIVTYQQLMS